MATTAIETAAPHPTHFFSRGRRGVVELDGRHQRPVGLRTSSGRQPRRRRAADDHIQLVARRSGTHLPKVALLCEQSRDELPQWRRHVSDIACATPIGRSSNRVSSKPVQLDRQVLRGAAVFRDPAAEVEHAHAARVIEARRALGLARKPSRDIGSAAQLRQQHLQGDVLTEPQVMAAQHRPHRAGADHGLHAIAIGDDVADLRQPRYLGLGRMPCQRHSAPGLKHAPSTSIRPDR